MRYWVYINDKVEGPFEEDKLVTLPGFTPDTLICAEEVAAGGSQEWVKASSIFEFDPVERRLYFGKEALIYPEGMHVLKNGEELQEPGSVLRFFPDGSASAAVLAFEYDGDLSILRVSPLTGSMAINEAE